MNDEISHKGIVEAISGSVIKVRLIQSNACSDCKIAELCTTAGSKEKVIDVRNFRTGHHKVGDHVELVATPDASLTAAVFAFGLPLAILLITMFVVRMLGASDMTMGLSGIATLVPYYIVLYLLRGYFDKKISFVIKDSAKEQRQQTHEKQ